MKKIVAFLFTISLLYSNSYGQFSKQARNSIYKITSADYQNMFNQFGITSFRPGVNGNDLKAPNAANYDESKADTLVC